jgi:hypothetical protein
MRRWLPAMALASAALVLVVAPRATSTASTAAFTDLDTLTGSTVTAGACASSTTWSTRVAALDTSGDSRAWQRMSLRPGSSSALDYDEYTGDSWSDTSVDTSQFAQSGALYCDPDVAVELAASNDYLASVSQRYSLWGANTSSTMLMWFKGTGSTAGLLVSLAEGYSGSSTYVDRTLWVTAAGTLNFGGRWGSSSSSEFVTTTSGPVVNDGQWHLVAVVMPNTSNDNADPTIYVDGEVAPATTTGTVRYRARSSSSTNAAWYIGDNNAGRDPTGAPTTAWIGLYDEFVYVNGTPSSTLLGASSASLYAAADS